MLRLIGAFILVVGLMGCGDDGPMAVVPEAGAGDGSMDSMIPPAPDSSTMPDADVPPPTGDAAVPGTEAASLSMAIRQFRSALCRCQWEDGEYESEAACVADVEMNAPSAEVLACEQEGLMAAAPTGASSYNCLLPLVAAFQACVEAATDCSEAALSACETTFQNGSDRCPELSEAEEAAFSTAQEECISGMAGVNPCPESSAGMMGDAVFSGSTLGAGNDVTPGCIMSEGGAPDRSFEWTASAAGDYIIDTVGSDYDTALVVRSSCDSEMQVACNDDAEDGLPGAGTLRSAVTVTATEAGQSFIITVDGYTGSAGNFVVNINAAPAAGM